MKSGERFLNEGGLTRETVFRLWLSEVLAAGSPDGDYVGLDEGQNFLFIGAISNVSIDCCFQWL